MTIVPDPATRVEAPEGNVPQSPVDSRRRKQIATAVLLTTAAIGAAGGMIITPVSLFSSSGPALAFPPLYAALAAVKLLPGVLAQSLIRRPGVALLAMVVVGLINIPFSTHGPMVFVSLAAVGLLQEIVFAVGLYRVWSWWMHVISNVFVIVVLAVIGLRAIATPETAPTVMATYWAVAVLSALVIVAVGLLISNAVARTGVITSIRSNANTAKK
ncbi:MULTISPECIES: ECF transporter S component [Gulosibacter]|uniref:ECF transporter S component n=1 Tax=Gulosibacter TaxID=256818 RepID=UPI00191AA71B|nr:ECF transporter S component [Gulosibacter hominis]